MKLSTSAEVIGIGAVVVSLIFVAYELRQNSMITAVDSAQHLAEMGQELSMLKMQPEFADLILKATNNFESLSQREHFIFTEIVRSEFNLWEQAYLSHREGVLLDDVWEIWNASFCEETPTEWFRAFAQFDPGGSFLPEFLALQKQCSEERL